MTAHHWSFGMNGCQFRHKLVEAGASEEETLSFLLTDPLGRSVGVDPVTGEKIDDFGRDSSATTVLRPSGWVTLQEAALVSGEYTLTAAGHNSSQERAYEIQLTRSAVRGDDVVSERTTIRERIIMRDGAIEPVRFSLFVPEPSATAMVAWGILMVATCRRRMRQMSRANLSIRR